MTLAAPGEVTAVNCAASVFNPYKAINGAGNPYIRGQGSVSCGSLAAYIQIEVYIYMLGGGCSTWCRLSTSGGTFYNTNVYSGSATASSGVCAGTRQYKTLMLYSYGLPNSGTLSKWSGTVTISC